MEPEVIVAVNLQWCKTTSDLQRIPSGNSLEVPCVGVNLAHEFEHADTVIRDSPKMSQHNSAEKIPSIKVLSFKHTVGAQASGGPW